MGRPRKFAQDDEINHWYSGEWRVNFTKEWEETTAMLRKAHYDNKVIGYELIRMRGGKKKKKLNLIKSDSIYLKEEL